jgi:hypothetical protein
MRVASRVLGRGALQITLYSSSYHKKALVKVVQICDLNSSERKETAALLTTEFLFLLLCGNQTESFDQVDIPRG